MTRFSVSLFTILMITSFLLIIFSSQLPQVQAATYSTSSFFQEKFSKLLSGVISMLRLQKENQQLRIQHASVLQRYAEVLLQNDSPDQLRLENAQLHRLLELSEQVRPPFDLAKVIAKDSSLLSRSLLLDKGSNEGIQLSAPVLGVDIQSGTLGFVGMVSSVASDNSSVRLITDPSINIIVRIFRLRNEGLLIGTGRQVMVKYIDMQSAQYVRNGDMIVTSGLSSLVPPDLPVGRVEAIIEHSHELTVDLVLNPIVDLTRMEYAFVLSGWKQQ